MSKVRGVMTCLMINDIDAGLAHFKNTQARIPPHDQAPACPILVIDLVELSTMHNTSVRLAVLG